MSVSDLSSIVNVLPLSVGGSKTYPLDLRTQFRPRKRELTLKCSALNVRCGGAEQTQTIARKAPAIHKTPTHFKEKLPRLDDGGSGFPPGFSGGGGGGGGGDGDSSGGGFLFVFLVFMDLLKDIETKHNNKNRRG